MARNRKDFDNHASFLDAMAGGSDAAPSPVAPPPPKPVKKHGEPKRPRPAGQRNAQNLNDDNDEDEDVIDLANHEVRVVRPGNKPANSEPAQPRIRNDNDAHRKPKPVPVTPPKMPSPKVEQGPQPKVPSHDLSQEHPPPRVPTAPPNEKQNTPQQDAGKNGSVDDVGTSDALSALAHDERSPMPTILDPALGVNPTVEFNRSDNESENADADAHAAMAAAAPTPHANAAQARQAREARQAKLQGLQTQSMGFQFRQVAIPLLLVMALVLGVIAGLAMYLGLNYDPLEDKENLLLENGVLFGGIAGILAVALFIGAFVFHWEVRRARKQERETNLKKPRRIP